MHIIFEGTDGCGKTNIATALCNKIGHQYFKLKNEKKYITELAPEELRKKHLFELAFMMEFLASVKCNVVFDRFYPSEIVYGQIVRNLPHDYVDTLYSLDKDYAALDTRIILLSKSDEKLHDDIFPHDVLVKVKKGYEEFAQKSACRILQLNTDSENLDEQLETIITFLNS